MIFIMIQLCPMKGSAIISLSYSLTIINCSISAEEKDSANLWPISVCRDWGWPTFLSGWTTKQIQWNYKKKSAILCHDNEDTDDDYFVSPSQKTPTSTPPTFLFWMPAEKQWMVRTVDNWLSHPSPPNTFFFALLLRPSLVFSLYHNVKVGPTKGNKSGGIYSSTKNSLAVCPGDPPASGWSWCLWEAQICWQNIAMGKTDHQGFWM